MATYTDNMKVPYLDQNVAQPEIPENVAKDVFDAIFSGMYTTDIIADSNYTFPYAVDPVAVTPWQNYIHNFTDTGVVLTGAITITFPINNRPYILMNNTAQTLNFEIVGQVTPIAVLTGTNIYAYSNGTDLIKINFA